MSFKMRELTYKISGYLALTDLDGRPELSVVYSFLFMGLVVYCRESTTIKKMMREHTLRKLHLSEMMHKIREPA